MSSETFSAGEFHNSPRPDAILDLKNAELLGAYDECVKVGQEFGLSVRPGIPRYIEHPYGVTPRIVDNDFQPDISYNFRRVNEDPEAWCQWLLLACDATIPVELHGAATADRLNHSAGVIRKGMRFIFSEVGLAIPEALGEKGEPVGDVTVHRIERKDRKFHSIGPVTDVVWPSTRGAGAGSGQHSRNEIKRLGGANHLPPTAGGAAEN